MIRLVIRIHDQFTTSPDPPSKAGFKVQGWEVRNGFKKVSGLRVARRCPGDSGFRAEGLGQGLLASTLRVQASDGLLLPDVIQAALQTPCSPC